MRVVSYFGDGESGASEIHARAKFRGDVSSQEAIFARTRISPESPKLETTCNLSVKFICIPAVHIISFSVSFLSRVDELNKLASLQCMGLHSSAGRALQR